jgi:hypothetical protein
MRFSRKMIYAAATPLTLAGLLATTAATPASAAVRPPLPREAYGSMELGSPLQYETFLALQGFGRNHGMVNYTNWTYAEPGSGVYAPKNAALPLTFVYQGQQYGHTLNNGLKLIARSPDRLAFSGTGAYSGGGTWKIAGHIKDARLTATIAYDGQTYKVFLAGKVAADGSVSGTATSSTGQALTFSMPAGSFVSVLHYVAPIKADQIKGRDATFRFTIPAKVAGLGGTKVTVKVHDGGWGARHDRYAHGVTGTRLQPYPIIGGRGVTVR